MNANTIYKILGGVLVVAAIYYLFFTGPGSDESSTASDSLTTKEQAMVDTIRSIKPKPVVKNENSDKNVNRAKSQKSTNSPRTTTRSDNPDIYIVKEGETLQMIAQDIYGDSKKWMKIFAANESYIDDYNIIVPGQKLRIPSVN
ncbi:MAG: LysM peptidoglycan-binding domain-containing protein [Melioribacteraceae bacterium]|nr:LysM peptidoglycan-binding domain-containing protein [Melioribacteraceae bacterium]MCF8266409.1 LysM peptidoglycan-binding domain-containing protein [Melioribacteraceae bacterium]MCF8413387.1 LysM peptidoglycan-binding domain-containing protein [Melioribacteraceae bacterium]